MSDPIAVSRRLVAVFAADVEGYSRLMGADEVGTLKSLTERRAILDRIIGGHGGRIANTAGDRPEHGWQRAGPDTRCVGLCPGIVQLSVVARQVSDTGPDIGDYSAREQPREHGNPDEGVRSMSRPEDVSWQTAVAIAIIVAASLALLLFMVRPGP